MSGAWGQIAGALLGGGLGYLGSHGPNSTTTSNAPWQPLQQPILDAFVGQGGSLLNTPQGYYPGSTVAPVSAAQTAGMTGAFNQAQSPHLSQAATGAVGSGLGFGNTGRNFLSSSLNRGGSPTQFTGNVPQVTAGNVGSTNVSTGGSNSRLGDMFNRGADQIQTRLSSQFGGGGRYGSGLHQRAQGDSLGNFATSLYGQAYDSDENRRLQAGMANQSASLQAGLANQRAGLQAGMANQGGYLNTLGLGANLYNSDESRKYNAANSLVGDQRSLAQMAPGLDQANYLPYQQMLNVGGMDRGFNQEMVNADKARFDHNMQEPWQRISNFLGMIPGNYNQQTSPLYNNPLAGAIGGAATGASLFNQPRVA